jgi:hypothetical protein
MSVIGLPPPPFWPAENSRMIQFASSKTDSNVPVRSISKMLNVAEAQTSTISAPNKSMYKSPLQSAMKTPKMSTLKKKSKSLSFSEPLVLIKGFPSKEECIEAATKIQSVTRGRQGRIKLRYSMLLQQLDNADGKREQEIVQI